MKKIPKRIVDMIEQRDRLNKEIAEFVNEKGKADGARQFVGWLDEQDIVVIPEKDYGEYEPNVLRITDLLSKHEKEQKNDE